MTTTAAPVAAAHRPSVLVVEDERIVARDLQEELAAMGYDSSATASSAEEAVARASERCPDVVLMDIRIHGKLDGIDTAHLLRARFGSALIYLTAHADEATLERAKLTEPHGYLLKPVRTAELRTAIAMALHKHELERRQRERERWFVTTLDAIHDAVIAVDHHGQIAVVNDAAARMVGVLAEEAIGRPAAELLQVAGPPLQRLTIVEGTHVGEVYVFRDPSSQHTFARRLEVTDRLASLGALAAGVAHEVNNPLSVVVANAAYVSDELGRVRDEHGPETAIDEAIAAQGELANAADRIARIIGDLREFMRPPAEDDVRGDVSVAVGRALRTTAAMLRDRARVVTEIAEVPPIACDEPRLAQVLVNLLQNAAQAIAPGDARRHTVHVRVQPIGDRSVEIEVADTGVGIPPELIERVFEPFFTTKPVGVGTGLGLAVCRGIVTQLGGEITAHSQVGHGTSVRVLLPIAGAPPAVAAAAEPRRARLLVVDDEEAVRRALVRMLREHEVVTADGAAAAIAKIATEPPFDVIFTDVTMPDMTGIELYEHLRAERPDDARRVVFVTGGGADDDVSGFLAGVPNPHIEKPVRGTTLDEVIAQVRAATSSPG